MLAKLPSILTLQMPYRYPWAKRPAKGTRDSYLVVAGATARRHVEDSLHRLLVFDLAVIAPSGFWNPGPGPDKGS